LRERINVMAYRITVRETYFVAYLNNRKLRDKLLIDLIDNEWRVVGALPDSLCCGKPDHCISYGTSCSICHKNCLARRLGSPESIRADSQIYADKNAQQNPDRAVWHLYKSSASQVSKLRDSRYAGRDQYHIIQQLKTLA
jgi:hypothetical protein